jgi:hypothetical protein
MSRRWRRAALVGNGALVGVRGRLGAGKHKQGPGKLSTGSGRAMDTWWRLPMAARGSPEMGIGRRRRLLLGMLTAREPGVQLEQVQAAGVTKQKGEGDKASTRAECCGGEVAAGGGSGGRGARKTGHRGRARAAGNVQATRGEGSSRRWSGGGLHSSDGEVLCTGGREQQRRRGAPEEEEGGGEGRRPVWKFQKFQGLLGKAKFSTNLKV